MKLKDTGLTFQDIKDKVDKYMIETYERFDFLAETAKDQYMYDENGTPYLDFYAGIAVNSAGNCNEKVVAAVKDQVEDIMHTFNYPYTIPQALLAEKICTTIGMDKIFYQNSGTEANEAMIKMARKYGVEKYGPKRYNIVTASMGFHGRTFGAMSATGQPDNGCQIGFGPNKMIDMAKKTGGIDKETLSTYVILLSPFAPHIAEELWQVLGHDTSVFAAKWPEHDEDAMKDDEVEVPVQINGKTRAVISIPVDISKEDAIAKGKEAVADKLTGTIVKEIYVPKKIINIVQK